MIIFSISCTGHASTKVLSWAKKEAHTTRKKIIMTNCASQLLFSIAIGGGGRPGPLWLSLIMLCLPWRPDKCAPFTTNYWPLRRSPSSHSSTVSPSWRREGRCGVWSGEKKHGHKQLHTHTHTYTQQNPWEQNWMLFVCGGRKKKHGQRRDEMRRKKNLLNLVPFHFFISIPTSHLMCKLHVCLQSSRWGLSRTVINQLPLITIRTKKKIKVQVVTLR